MSGQVAGRDIGASSSGWVKWEHGPGTSFWRGGGQTEEVRKPGLVSVCGVPGSELGGCPESLILLPDLYLLGGKKCSKI